MNRRMAALRTLAVGTLVVALGSAAFGADTATVASANATHENGAAAAHATVHVDLSGVANSVVDLLVGGSNPSTEKRGGSHATTTKSHADNDNDEATETEVSTNHVSAGQQVAQTATAGEKPGFGCGDKNHTHMGPPGRPGATPPPGCTKNH